jgi:hypothetical protein
MTQAPFYWTRDPTTAISIGIQQRKGRKVQTEGEDVKRLLAVTRILWALPTRNPDTSSNRMPS